MADALYQLKQDLIDFCISLLSERIESINSSVESLKDAQANETKSSAGDKFETSREMMQTEIDKLEGQIAQKHSDRALLKQHKALEPQLKASEGSMIQTDRGIFLLSAGLGKVKMNDKIFFVISKEAPIANPILGCQVNDSFSFNGNGYKVELIA